MNVYLISGGAMTEAKPDKLRNIGEIVLPFGVIGAVGCIQGERYYWLLDKYGAVSMMPADVIEGGRDD